ncbi:LssY C-terminal domain-containing protein [Aquicoccus sp. G2-2]|uniref:LssY C-terminal domain-containing protein n=1 Tax=Aquicoccus sp. G2-2 TaxID=3092120 RepID=UPI002AE041A1|nr:LssY C-terminal domain-containing protein [Aquicoccus sp. G2-2]MEA1113903.1 LssY C-terminal domain-containing protein [Aquicoccus sp. G2-2]
MIAAKDAQAISAAMQKGGWIPAPKPGLGILSRAFWADWTGAAIPRPLVIPTFWNNRPNDFAFARPDDSPNTPLRLHVRLWRTDFTTNGLTIFLGTLTFEDPLDWVTASDEGHRALARKPAQLDAFLGALRASGLVAVPAR